MGYEVTN